MTPFWRDKFYILALLAGPLVWVGLFIAGLHNLQQTPFKLTLVLPVFIYPIIEEWFFRGTIQPAISNLSMCKTKWGALSLANVLTSLAFAGLHLVYQPTLWALAVFFPSLVFGWSKERYQTLLAPIILHVVYNAGFFLLF